MRFLMMTVAVLAFSDLASAQAVVATTRTTVTTTTTTTTTEATPNATYNSVTYGNGGVSCGGNNTTVFLPAASIYAGSGFYGNATLFRGKNYGFARRNQFFGAVRADNGLAEQRGLVNLRIPSIFGGNAPINQQGIVNVQ